MNGTNEQRMMMQKSRIKATVLTLSKELGIDIEEIPETMLGDLEKFSVEELLNMGDAKLSFLQSLNVEGRVTPEEARTSVKGLAAILKSVEERDKPKSRAEMAAHEH